MKPKPNGPNYRNLYVPKDRDTIYYARVVGGRRFRVNTKRPPTEGGWKEAAVYRDKYEELKGIGRARVDVGTVPSLAQLSLRYFESQKFSKLAATSQQDRRSHLAPDGPVMSSLAGKRVDEITADTLVDWWEHEARQRAWSVETGFRYLSTIAEVLKVGRRYLHGRTLPSVEARERIGEQRRTAAGRAGGGPQVRPIEDAAAIGRLVEEARDEDPELFAFVLVLLDAGLRKGEALALRWRQVAWGTEEDDRRRHLVIEASRSRGRSEDGNTKSGRTRRVGLSRRLRGVLGDLFQQRRPRDLGELVFSNLDTDGLRRAWPALRYPSGSARRPPEGSPGHIREPASHRGDPDPVGEPAARPRRRQRDGAPLREVPGRERRRVPLRRAGPPRAGRSAGRPVGPASGLLTTCSRRRRVRPALFPQVARNALVSTPEAIATLVRASDFKTPANTNSGADPAPFPAPVCRHSSRHVPTCGRVGPEVHVAERYRVDGGSIFQHGSSWWADVHHGGRRLRRRAATRKDAERLVPRLRAELSGRRQAAEHERPTPRSVIKLEEALEAYLLDMQARRCRERSVGSARSSVNVALRVWGADARLSHCASPEGLADFMAARVHVAAHTVRRDLRVIGAAFRLAVKRGHLDAMPQLPKVKADTPDPHVLTAAELQHLLAAALRPEVHAILTTAAYTGARAGELVALRWEDVQDLDGDHPELLLRLTKGRRPRRVPLHAKVREVLRPLPRRSGGHVFRNSNDERWVVSDLSAAARTVWKRAGLFQPGHTKPLHSLRATCASLMVERGASLQEVCDLLGWASVAVAPHYLKSSEQRRRRAIDLL